MPTQVISAQQYFPRGLTQPAGSFKFSVDALLLAYFLPIPSYPVNILDMGTGCGVVSLAMLLSNDQATAVGIDNQPLLLEAAMQNAKLLGVAHRFTTVLHTINSSFVSSSHLTPNSFTTIVANPPYRIIGHGRLPENPLRSGALFGEQNLLNSFCYNANILLKDEGKFAIIIPLERYKELCVLVNKHNFFITRTLHIKPTADKPAKLVIIEATKNATIHKEIYQELILYEKADDFMHITQEALTYCPLLSCNKTRVMVQNK